MCLMSSLCVSVVNNYMFYMAIMRYLVAKPISITLNLKPKYGYCHLSALTHLPVPCISGFLALNFSQSSTCTRAEPS